MAHTPAPRRPLGRLANCPHESEGRPHPASAARFTPTSENDPRAMSNTALSVRPSQAALGLLLLLGCTLDVGQNFQVAEVVYDDNFFYCQVEPMMFQQGCGKGDPSRGESAQGCHFNRQRLRL